MPNEATVDHAARQVGIRTPLGDETFLVAALHGWEEMNRGFEFEVELFSEDHAVDFDALVGQPVSVRVDREGLEPRAVHGIVSDFEYLPATENYARYRARIVPWTWFLSRHTDCRIFQNQSPIDIVLDLFREHGFHDFELQLDEIYPARTYCVQYAETDLAFVSRLLEEIGVATFFRHELDRHVLVLSDVLGGSGPIRGCESIAYQPAWERPRRPETVWDWHVHRRLRPEHYAINGYDYENPRRRLLGQSQCANGHGAMPGETYEYDPTYSTAAQGEERAKLRLEALQARYEIVSGTSDSRSLTTGGTFALEEAPRADQAREYLVLSTRYRVVSNVMESESREGSEGEVFQVAFTAIAATVRFRPLRTTFKPKITGPQTAVVVGKDGEELWTDELGRIKVQFHWDRLGALDENSSCWVRVAQAAAGRGWGDFRLPRVGQEVVVEFLEGDPDLPLVTGSVYNGTHSPPFELPRNQTQWGTKTSSTDGTGGFNELRFEDKAGDEQIFLRAERDLDCRIGHDSRRLIEGNDDNIVRGNHREEVEGDRHRMIGGDQFEQITGTYQLKLGGEIKEVENDSSVIVGGNRAEDVGGSYELSVGGSTEVNSQTIKLNAQSSIEICCGGSSIKLSPGAIVIEAPVVMIKGSQTTVKGGLTTIKGSVVKVDAPVTKHTGQNIIGGNLMVKGAAVITNPLVASTSVVTPSVVAASYSPGAGNLM